MAGRSPARFLAPLALVAVVIALVMVVSSSLNDSGGDSGSDRTSGTPTATPTPERQRRGPRRYRVKEGDTPTSIADKTGVPLEQILELNPDLDPQTLAPGQRIRLRE